MCIAHIINPFHHFRVDYGYDDDDDDDEYEMAIIIIMMMMVMMLNMMMTIEMMMMMMTMMMVFQCTFTHSLTHPCEHMLISSSLDCRSSLSHKLSRKYPNAFFGARWKFLE